MKYPCPLHKEISYWKCRFCSGIEKYYPKILIATPITYFKEYSLGRWVDNIKSFSYPNFDIFVADGSPTTDLYDRWKDKIDMIHIDNSEFVELHELQKNLCFEECRKKFLAGDYDRLVTIESDIIPPKNIIETMYEWGRDADWISFSFPNRENQQSVEQGLGCCMFTRRFMEKYDWGSMGDNFSSDAGLWLRCKNDKDFRTAEFWHFIEIEHLKE